MITECEGIRIFLALLDEFDQLVNLRLIEHGIIHEFHKLKVFSGTKQMPWLIIYWFRQYQLVLQGSLEFLRADDTASIPSCCDCDT